VLKGIHPLLSADLLHALQSMGHGDSIAIVDANFPAAANAKRLIESPGANAPARRRSPTVRSSMGARPRLGLARH